MVKKIPSRRNFEADVHDIVDKDRMTSLLLLLLRWWSLLLLLMMRNSSKEEKEEKEADGPIRNRKFDFVVGSNAIRTWIQRTHNPSPVLLASTSSRVDSIVLESASTQ